MRLGVESGVFPFQGDADDVFISVEDRFGHRISYLRISITDRCNERCLYCLPEEKQEWLPRDGILTYEEIIRIVRIGAGMGVRKLRVTGGEPLTRRGVLGFFRMLQEVPGIEDTGISTNGTLLAEPPAELPGDTTPMARHLTACGVRTANISLDTLDPAVYAAITSRDYHARALAGIDAALAAGFGKVKLNCVLIKGRTENELPALVEFAAQRGCLLRFIELMPVSSREVLTESNFLSCGVTRQLLEAHYGALLHRPEVRTNGPASYYQIPGRDQLVGFIGAMTNLHFCESCNKLRLTADGKLRPCLGSHLETDLITPMRSGAADDDLRRLILNTVERKPKEHDFRGSYQPGRRMIAIGG
jgi:cyclic pyranopterin phosphate synthase